MLPARQRFGTDHAAVSEGDDRLEPRGDLVGTDSGAKILLVVLPLQQALLQLPIECANTVTAALLDPSLGGIGEGEHRVGIGATVVGGRRADAQTHVDGAAPDHERNENGIREPLRDHHRFAWCRHRLQQHGKIVATDTRDEILAQARTDAEAVTERAREEITAEKEKAMAELRAQVADLALEAAGKLVRSDMNATTQRRLVEEFLAETSARPSAKAREN